MTTTDFLKALPTKKSLTLEPLWAAPESLARVPPLPLRRCPLKAPREFQSLTRFSIPTRERPSPSRRLRLTFPSLRLTFPSLRLPALPSPKPCSRKKSILRALTTTWALRNIRLRKKRTRKMLTRRRFLATTLKTLKFLRRSKNPKKRFLSRFRRKMTTLY